MELSEIMKSHRIRDVEIAKITGISRSQVSRIRRGLSDPPLSTYRQLMAAAADLVCEKTKRSI
jgi:transcriptional regulator with XRE-family HTH domain